jgi:single-strand DNA-binding protein
MSSLNKVCLIGRVGKEPEISQDNKWVKFTLATSESWKDKSGEKKELTEWHNIISFQENVVKLVKNYIQKGSLLYIEGKLKTSKYQDKQGNDKYTTQVEISYGGCIKMIGSKPNNDENEVVESKSITQQANESSDEIPF